MEPEEEPRADAWGKTIDQALTRMREAAALWFQIDEASIELVPRPVLPKTMGRTVEQARKARDRARNADHLAIEQTQKQPRRSPAAGSACVTPRPSSASLTSGSISCSRRDATSPQSGLTPHTVRGTRGRRARAARGPTLLVPGKSVEKPGTDWGLLVSRRWCPPRPVFLGIARCSTRK